MNFSTLSLDRRSAVAPSDVHDMLRRHMLADGFDIVADLRNSSGSFLYDLKTGKRFLDFFTFFASSPIGLNHPDMLTDEFRDRLFHAAVNKPSNSDVYSVEMADFVQTFSRVGIPDYLPHAFFIAGGALAVENALKTAFDWKVQKNFAKGYRTEKGHKVIHFENAFHGRSGYTMTMTNTDPRKVKYFPKFDGWPRIISPAMHFPINDEMIGMVEKNEADAIEQIKQAFLENTDDIAAIIIEPIQGEGGDNHFRFEFMQALRTLADENDALLIFDEVQTGVGLTGRFWAHEYFVQPDILAFGKKMQVCGILAGTRIDEVPDNVFHASSRINSTWGGCLVDMVRSQRYLEIIEREALVRNGREVGKHLLDRINALCAEFPGLVDNPRGRGLFCAMDIATQELRNHMRQQAYDKGLLILGTGIRGLRFRPALNVTRNEIDEGIEILRDVLLELKSTPMTLSQEKRI